MNALINASATTRVSHTPANEPPREATLVFRTLYETAAPELLVQDAVAGDVAAWQALQAWAFPLLERWVRSHPSMRRRRLHRLVDDVYEVVTATLERLRASEFANLSKYLSLRSRDPEATIEGWLYGAMDFTVREHLRARFGRVQRRTPDDQDAERLARSKRDLNTLAPRVQEDVLPMARDALTARLTWSQIMNHVRAQFTTRDTQAIQHYIEHDASYEELAELLGLASADDAERMIRKLKERLRVRFRPDV